MSRLNYAQVSPEITKALYGLEKSVSTGAIEKKTYDLVKLRASQLNGCALCTDMHSKEAIIHDERPLRLLHLPIWRESNLFSPRERAALEWTELLTNIPAHGIEDEAFAKVSAHFNEKEVSDLTLLIGTINLWNRLGVSFRAEPGSMDKFMGLDKAGLK